MENVLKLILLIIVIISVLVGIWFITYKIRKTTAINKVDEIFVALKTGEKKNIEKYISYDENGLGIEVNRIEDTQLKFIMTKLLAGAEENMLQNVSYEIKDCVVFLNQAAVTVNISNKNFEEMVNKYFTVSEFAEIFNNEDITDEEKNKKIDEYYGENRKNIEEKIKQYVISQYNSNVIETQETEYTFFIIVENGKWVIDEYEYQEHFIEAVLPNYKFIKKEMMSPPVKEEYPGASSSKSEDDGTATGPAIYEEAEYNDDTTDDNIPDDENLINIVETDEYEIIVDDYEVRLEDDYNIYDEEKNL